MSYVAIKSAIKLMAIELYVIFLVLRNNWFPTHLIEYDGGIGDDLMCTTLTHEIKKNNRSAKIWVVTKYPELFEGNESITAVIYKGRLRISQSRILRNKKLDLSYTRAKDTKNMQEDIPPKEHIISVICKQAGIKNTVKVRTYLYLSEAEKNYGNLHDKQIVIQCIDNSSGTLMKNKLWYKERYQSVVNKILTLNSKISIIQVGSSADPLLEGVVDLRGKTTIRQTAAILSQSICFIGTVGFLMHLANAVSCKSVIVFGGREHSWQSGYPENYNIESLIECAPCWKWNDCGKNRQCMQEISSDQVFASVARIFNQYYA